MRIVLDTHVLVQAASGSIAPARAALLRENPGSLHVSAISLWEIAKLIEKGRIQPVDPPAVYLARIYQHPLYRIEPIEPALLAKMLEIAPRLHRDPADQLIVSTAALLQASLMTDDRAIIGSGLVPVL